MPTYTRKGIEQNHTDLPISVASGNAYVFRCQNKWKIKQFTHFVIRKLIIECPVAINSFGDPLWLNIENL